MRMEGKKLRKIKLGILTMGILILGVILSLKYGGAADKTEMEFSDRRETEEAPGARESGTEEPEPELLPFTGSIRVLLKTDGFAGLLHEKATFISENGNDLILTDRDTGETIEEGWRAVFKRRTAGGQAALSADAGGRGRHPGGFPDQKCRSSRLRGRVGNLACGRGLLSGQ